MFRPVTGGVSSKPTLDAPGPHDGPQHPHFKAPIHSAETSPVTKRLHNGLWYPPVRPSWADEPSAQLATTPVAWPTAQVPHEKHELDRPQSFDWARFTEASIADAQLAEKKRQQLEDEWCRLWHEDKLRCGEEERQVRDEAQMHLLASHPQTSPRSQAPSTPQTPPLYTPRSQVPSRPLTRTTSHPATPAGLASLWQLPHQGFIEGEERPSIRGQVQGDSHAFAHLQLGP